MFRVLTEDESEKELLSQESMYYNEAFFVSNTHVQPIIEMVRSITYEDFQTDLPFVAKKVRDLLIDSLNMTINLISFRQLMHLIRRQTQVFSFSQSYEREINPSQENTLENMTQFRNDVKQQKLCKNIKQIKVDQAELPLQSKIELKADQNTEKSIQSQIIDAKNPSYMSSISKFSQFLKPSPSINKPDENKNDSSIELQQFQKKGKDLMENNIETLIRDQAVDDIKKQLKTVRKVITKNSEIEYYRWNKQIKDCIMNSKLKRRRK